MAIIGRIRKHSGLAVIIVGVAIAAFVIGDFGKKRMKSTNEIGSVNGEAIPYPEFTNKVEENIQLQKENSGTEKITDEETYSIRTNTWNSMTSWDSLSVRMNFLIRSREEILTVSFFSISKILKRMPMIPRW